VTRGRRRAAAALGLAAVAAVVVIAMVSGGGRARLPRLTPPAGIAYGANVNWLFNDPAYTGAQIAAQLTELHSAGATIARTDSLWERSEPSPPSDGVHHFDWTFDDGIVTALSEHDLRWLPIVDYAPPWASVDSSLLHSPPATSANYAAYAGALAARYGPGGTFWREHPQLPQLPAQQFEIWNEPDNPDFWAPMPNAAAYAHLYAAARTAIDAADPSATVLVGGLTNPPGFLPEMLAADPSLRDQIDGVAIHPYAYSPAAVLGRVVRARAVLDANGMSRVPMYVTEFGWTTSPAGALNYAPAAQRPGDIETAIEQLALSGCGLSSVILYTWATPDIDPGNSQNWYGIDPPSAGGGADVTAFVNGLRAARANAGAATTGSCGT
jgi:hypothetical protein